MKRTRPADNDQYITKEKQFKGATSAGVRAGDPLGLDERRLCGESLVVNQEDPDLILRQAVIYNIQMSYEIDEYTMKSLLVL